MYAVCVNFQSTPNVLTDDFDYISGYNVRYCWRSVQKYYREAWIDADYIQFLPHVLFNGVRCVYIPCSLFFDG